MGSRSFRDDDCMTTKASENPAPPAPVSRAVNVSVDTAKVVAMCAKHKVTISAIEALPSGGTRVVLMNSTDAAAIVKAFGSKVIAGPVPRTHWLRARHEG